MNGMWPERDGRKDAEAQSASATFDHDLGRALLTDILATDRFRKAPRQAQLLEYLIETECRGEGERINAYTIAFDVFHRSTDFDPAVDSAVRVEMHRLRANLDRWANDPANRREQALSFAPRFYRPRIVTRTTSVIPPPDTSMPLDRRPWRLIPWVLLTLVFVVVGGAFLWTRAGEASCRSARPYLMLPDAFEGKAANAQDSMVIQQLEAFLRYYPLVDGVRPDETLCNGVPVYSLKLAQVPNDPGGLIAMLYIENEHATTLSQERFEMRQGSSERDRDIATAQIAYFLAASRGVIPLDAMRRPWGDRRAFDEFACLNRVHEYYVVNVPSEYGAVHGCMMRHIQTSTRADVAGLLAALEGELKLVPGTSSHASPATYDRAVKRAAALDPNNSELLMAELRRARNYGHIDESRVHSLIDRMERVFPFEPHIINQIAITQAVFLGEFEEARRHEALARRIMRKTVGIEWARIYTLTSEGRYAELKAHAPALEASDLPFAALALILLGESIGDEAMIARAHARQTATTCGTRQCLLDYVAGTGFNPALRTRLNGAIHRHFT